MVWPFQRRRGSAAEATQIEQPAREEAWRALPPLDGMVTGVLGTPAQTRTLDFVRNLPSRWHQPPVLAPLGHDVRPDAASGLVGGLVSTAGRSLSPRGDSSPAELRWLRAVPSPTRPTSSPTLSDELPAARPAAARPAAARPTAARPAAAALLGPAPPRPLPTNAGEVELPAISARSASPAGDAVSSIEPASGQVRHELAATTAHSPPNSPLVVPQPLASRASSPATPRRSRWVTSPAPAVSSAAREPADNSATPPAVQVAPIEWAAPAVPHTMPIADRDPEIADPAVLDPAALDPAVLDPAVLDPAALGPATDKTRPAAIDGDAPPSPTHIDGGTRPDTTALWAPFAPVGYAPPHRQGRRRTRLGAALRDEPERSVAPPAIERPLDATTTTRVPAAASGVSSPATVQAFARHLGETIEDDEPPAGQIEHARSGIEHAQFGIGLARGEAPLRAQAEHTANTSSAGLPTPKATVGRAPLTAQRAVTQRRRLASRVIRGEAPPAAVPAHPASNPGPLAFENALPPPRSAVPPQPRPFATLASIDRVAAQAAVVLPSLAGGAVAALPDVVPAVAAAVDSADGSAPSGPLGDVPHTVEGLLGGAVHVAATPAAATHDSAALDRLAGQLYGRLRSQLASELLVGRERAQLLTDL